MAAAVAIAVKKRHKIEDAIASGEIVVQPTKTKKMNKVSLLPESGTGCWKYQRQAAVLYLNFKVQMFVAGLITGNFLFNIAEKWADPKAVHYPLLWDLFDTFFNVMFTLELGLNMYAFWFWRFWKSAWNVFDFVVVSIGLLGVFKVPLPGPLSLLRMMRAFRVFRLFKRVKSLNKIIVSLGKALPSHMNAIFILLLVMSIYAILAVEFFMNFGSEGYFVNELNQTVDLMTGRNLEYGFEYWGNYGKSLYTMFQVLTGESWSEAVARPLLHTNDEVQSFGVALFFVSFQLICGIVLINVVIAILLEKMVDDGSEALAAAAEAAEEEDEGEEEVAACGEAASDKGDVTRRISIEMMETEVDQLKQSLAAVKQQLEVLTEALQTYRFLT